MEGASRDSESSSEGQRAVTPLLTLAACAVTFVMWMIGWLPAIDRVSGDLLMRTLPPPDTRRAAVATVLIDDRTVAREGPLPLARSRLATLVSAVADCGAAAIAVDLLLAEPSDPAGDRALAQALSRRPIAVAAALDRNGDWLLPLEVFGGAAVAAHAYGEVGPDGVVRTFAATKQAGSTSLPALSLAAARLIDPRIPVTPGTEIRPAFRPAPQGLPAVSAADVLDGRLSAIDIEGRLVLVGVSATGAGDQFVVPTGPRHRPVPGVLAHASAAESILDGRLLRRAPIWLTTVYALLLAFAVQLLRDRRGAFDLGRFSAILGGLFVIAVLAVRWGEVLLPVAALAVAAVTSALLREAVESRIARRETGHLLQSVLTHLGGDEPTARPPRTAGARLAALRHLQRRVLSEDATRRALLEGMAEGVVLWGPDGTVVEANPAAARLWEGVPDQDELDPAGGETIVRRGPRTLSVRTSDLEGGRLGLIRDVTAERTLEERRQEMQRLVSHELKTPLASITGFGETLERYTLSGDELKRVASLIRGEAQRLHEMVTVFLDLERLGSGHWEGAAETLDLAPLVARRMEILSAAAAARSLDIRTSLAAECRVRGVPVLLERVVDNLVGNAVAYTDRGDTIEVELTVQNGCATLVVRDHGPGIPREATARIFERFYRVPGRAGSGSGLGLALVKEVVSWHGGCIIVDSEEGIGTAFTVEMPVAAEV